ncbi:hypothetical protein J6590_010574 [Homalodisca vitripennis]|nr:hypothetical protein J6590_010574 [Homalodisca vitripennis]
MRGWRALFPVGRSTSGAANQSQVKAEQSPVLVQIVVVGDRASSLNPGRLIPVKIPQKIEDIKVTESGAKFNYLGRFIAYGYCNFPVSEEGLKKQKLAVKRFPTGLGIRFTATASHPSPSRTMLDCHF